MTGPGARSNRPGAVAAVAAAVAIVVMGAAACRGTATVATEGSAGPAGSADPARANAASTPVDGTATAPGATNAGFSCPASAAASGAIRSGPPTGERLRVVTTVAPITSIVANIAGDRAQVTGVIPEGEDSHTFEPKPSAAAVLSAADIVFVNGLKLEDPTRELAESNLKADGQVIELGTTTITPDQYLYDFSFPRDAGKPNPHLWTNPPMARCYATIAATAMARSDPANAGYYRDNLARYQVELDTLDQLMVAATAGIPEKNRTLLTYHDAYAYFAQRYGWRVIGAIQVSNFEEPTPREVAGLVEQVKAEGVPVIFGSEVFPSPVLAQIAAETGARYEDSLRDDDLPGAPGEPDHSFLGLMKYDFVTMVASLGGDATALRAFDTGDVAPDRADYPQ